MDTKLKELFQTFPDELTQTQISLLFALDKFFKGIATVEDLEFMVEALTEEIKVRKPSGIS